MEVVAFCPRDASVGHIDFVSPYTPQLDRDLIICLSVADRKGNTCCLIASPIPLGAPPSLWVVNIFGSAVIVEVIVVVSHSHTSCHAHQ